MQRRVFLQTIVTSIMPAPLLAATNTVPLVEVYKSEWCGCCEAWIGHLKANGFSVKAQNVSDTGEYRKKFGIPNDLGSCHTGIVQGYGIEGHVPAADIKRLLAERPKANGLAVPSMPLGSPGMEGPRKDPYDVFLVKADNSYSVYKHYTGQ